MLLFLRQGVPKREPEPVMHKAGASGSNPAVAQEFTLAEILRHAANRVSQQ
jgi:hypothetical protein